MRNCTIHFFILAALSGCQSTDGPISETESSPMPGYFCMRGDEKVSFRIVNQDLPPGFVMPPGPLETGTRAASQEELRVQLDTCVDSDDNIQLSRILVGRGDPSDANFLFHFFPQTPGGPDVIEGLTEALVDQDYSKLKIIDREGTPAKDLFYVVGVRHGGKAYAIAGSAGESTFVAGAIEPGNTDGQANLVCESGYEEMPFTETFGSAEVSGKLCVKSDMSGRSEVYGLELTVIDNNKKLTPERRGKSIYRGPEARSVFTAGSIHHACHAWAELKLPDVVYHSREASLPTDNYLEYTIKYDGHPEEKFKVPASGFRAPC